MARAGAPGVVLLENLRFHAEEEKNDPAFATQLAALADVYVNDAFGSAHRAHASTEGIVHLVPEAAAGLLMANEVAYLGKALTDPERPFVAILGGAKVSDKLEVIENLLPKVDALVIGGAMAYTFLKAQGVAVGRSLVEADLVDTARDLQAQADARGLHARAARGSRRGRDARGGRADRDAGRGRRGHRRRGWASTSARRRRRATPRIIRAAKTVVWNGPMGVFEIDAFANGHQHGGAGRGQRRRAHDHRRRRLDLGGPQGGRDRRISHISTGGGASLEFLGGRTLPGVAVLPEK